MALRDIITLSLFTIYPLLENIDCKESENSENLPERRKMPRWWFRRTRPPYHDRERARLLPIFVRWYNRSRFSKDPILLLRVPPSSWTDTTTARLGDPIRTGFRSREPFTVPRTPAAWRRGGCPTKKNRKKRNSEKFETRKARPLDNDSTRESNGES